MEMRVLTAALSLIGIAWPTWCATYYASPEGRADNTGNTLSAAWDVLSGLKNLKAGDSLIVAEGRYSIPYVPETKNTITLSQSGASESPITVSVPPISSGGAFSYAIFDFSFPSQDWVQDSFGLLISGDYWELNGIAVTRAGYQGVYVTGSHNTLKHCAFFENRNTGLEINKGGEYTTVIQSDAYRNYDPKKNGSMADGFGPKQTQGPGNRFIECRAWENSDDGFDTYDSPDSVVFENCWAFRNGVDVWGYGGFAGNGNGFKAGGNSQQANNRLVRCIAFGNPQKGFDQNNNTGGITLLNCLAYANGTNYGMGNRLNAGQMHRLINNISLGAGSDIANAQMISNSWNSGFRVTDADFISLDTGLALSPRQGNGKLSEIALFQLRAESPLLDAGMDVGLAYAGSAPDLGPFELNRPVHILGGTRNIPAKTGLHPIFRGLEYSLLGIRTAGNSCFGNGKPRSYPRADD